MQHSFTQDHTYTRQRIQHRLHYITSCHMIQYSLLYCDTIYCIVIMIVYYYIVSSHEPHRLLNVLNLLWLKCNVLNCFTDKHIITDTFRCQNMTVTTRLQLQNTCNVSKVTLFSPLGNHKEAIMQYAQSYYSVMSLQKRRSGLLYISIVISKKNK